MRHKLPSKEEIRQSIDAGRFDDLIGAVETQESEFKSEPYQLDKLSQKQELAKDVTAFAGANTPGAVPRRSCSRG